MRVEQAIVETMLASAETVVPAHMQDVERAGPRIKPLCDVADARVDDLLDHKPPDRKWLLDQLLPLGVVALLAAGGGTGKSLLSLQLAISIATGRPFLGLDVGETGAVLVVAAEDERDELHRRLWCIVQAMRDHDEFTAADDRRLRERLFIVPRVGENNLLTDVIGNTVSRTEMADRIRLTAEQIPDLKLIVLDPVSRFRGGNENANDAATRFIEVAETLRAETGATVLMPHHMSKDGLRAGAERLSAENLRGASALLDGARWAMAMATLPRDLAEKYGVNSDDASRYVRLDAVKNNYAPPWDGLWLYRRDGGVLVPVTLQRNQSKRGQQNGDERYQSILPQLKKLIRQHEEQGDPLTRNKLRDYAGKSGRFGVGDKTLRDILNRAIAEGHIGEDDTGSKRRGKLLRTWK